MLSLLVGYLRNVSHFAGLKAFPFCGDLTQLPPLKRGGKWDTQEERAALAFSSLPSSGDPQGWAPRSGPLKAVFDGFQSFSTSFHSRFTCFFKRFSLISLLL